MIAKNSSRDASNCKERNNIRQTDGTSPGTGMPAKTGDASNSKSRDARKSRESLPRANSTRTSTEDDRNVTCSFALIRMPTFGKILFSKQDYIG
jgi:hypothetical protein